MLQNEHPGAPAQVPTHNGHPLAASQDVPSEAEARPRVAHNPASRRLQKLPLLSVTFSCVAGHGELASVVGELLSPYRNA